MRIALVCLGLLLSALSLGQLTEHAALAKAIAFAQKIDPLTTATEAASFRAQKVGRSQPSPMRERWMIVGKFQILGVDGSTGDIVSYGNGKRYGAAHGSDSFRAPTRGKAFYHDESDLIAKASAKLEAIGWAHGPDVIKEHPFPTPDENGELGHAIIYVRFYERPNGYRLEGGANFCVIGLDSLSGDIIELDRALGYTFGPTTSTIDSTTALEAASAKIELGEAPDVWGPIYRQLSERADLSTRGRDLCRRQVVPLCFVVRGTKQDAYIAADNGEVLETHSNLTGSGATSNKVAGKTPFAESTPLPLSEKSALKSRAGGDILQQPEIWVAVFAALFLAWLALFFRQKT
ncbi:MAG: hypothetical protein HZC36_15590 [Armatimonadetes bacterium]|nr:hypothetical protein [Armatimonadota bacterium]